MLAVAAGVVVALVTYWGGAVLTLLFLRGIPLGSPGGPATTAELWVHLALGAAAGFLGAAVTTRLAKGSPHVHAAVLGVILGAGALVGFGQPASQWPAWFGAGMAAMCLVSVLAVVWAKRRG